ncbi:MAG TPA: NAD(P)H-binding protein [Acidimicrobiia bacterium]|jgi:NADH dehydrogenase|nr:NAD(P)H-binding protein [Acidimicrobiia bacterium]
MTPHVATTAHRRTDTGLDVVTGAFSYSGSAIANRLLAQGRAVRTLTGHSDRAPLGSPIDVRSLDFADLPGLVRALDGATTLYNTYWVRFAHGRTDHALAIENSRALFHAARQAGVQRIVHVSITNPSIDSPYPYFRGKALVERALAETGVGYTILRPAILFGGNGVLVNNIAWLLRRLPVFAVGGDGHYRIRPIHVDDLADLALASALDVDDRIVDAVGPDRPTFTELVLAVRDAVGSRARVVRIPGAFLPPISSVLNRMLRDVLLTRDEYHAMADGLADTDGADTAPTRITDWLAEHAATLGLHYANELQRHY